MNRIDVAFREQPTSGLASAPSPRTSEGSLVAQASQAHFQRQVQDAYDRMLGWRDAALAGAQQARLLAGLRNIGPETRERLTDIADNLTHWAGVHDAHARRIAQGVTPADLQALENTLASDPTLRAGQQRYGTHPVIGNLKQLENQVRAIGDGFADRLERIAADGDFAQASRDTARVQAASLREANAGTARLVEFAAGERPAVDWNALAQRVDGLRTADPWLSAAARIDRPPAPTVLAPPPAARADEPAMPARPGAAVPPPVRIGDTLVSWRFEGTRLVETRTPASGEATPVPLDRFLLPLEGRAGAHAPTLARIDAALHETLRLGGTADRLWQERPGQLAQRAFDATARAIGVGVPEADGQFRALRREYDGHWTDLLRARNDAANALNRGDQAALADASARVDLSLKQLVSTSESINGLLATTAERGIVTTLLPLELARGLVVAGGSATAFTVSAPSAAVAPPAPFLIAGATGATLEVATRPVFGFAAERLFGIDPATYQQSLPRLDVGIGTAFLGGAIAPVRLATPLRTGLFQAGANTTLNTAGAFLDDGRLSRDELLLSIGTGVAAGSLDGLQQQAAARNIDLAAGRMLDLPTGTTARIDNVRLTRTADGVRLDFDGGAAVLRAPDGRYRVDAGNTAPVPDAVANPSRVDAPAPTQRAADASPPSAAAASTGRIAAPDAAERLPEVTRTDGAVTTYADGAQVRYRLLDGGVVARQFERIDPARVDAILRDVTLAPELRSGDGTPFRVIAVRSAGGGEARIPSLGELQLLSEVLFDPATFGAREVGIATRIGEPRDVIFILGTADRLPVPDGFRLVAHVHPRSSPPSPEDFNLSPRPLVIPTDRNAAVQGLSVDGFTTTPVYGRRQADDVLGSGGTALERIVRPWRDDPPPRGAFPAGPYPFETPKPTSGDVEAFRAALLGRGTLPVLDNTPAQPPFELRFTAAGRQWAFGAGAIEHYAAGDGQRGVRFVNPYVWSLDAQGRPVGIGSGGETVVTPGRAEVRQAYLEIFTYLRNQGWDQVQFTDVFRVEQPGRGFTGGTRGPSTYDLTD